MSHAAGRNPPQPSGFRAGPRGFCLRFGGLILLTACSDSVVAPDITPRAMSAVVTGTAASNLDAAGRFRLKGPPTTGARQLTMTEAERLASLWPEQFGPWIRSVLEKEHGGPIAFADLKVCGRTLYAESPLEPFDPTVTADPMAAVAQRVFGPWWLVTLCGSAGEPQVNLGVSAYATDLSIKSGRIIGPAIGGEWFSPVGIPGGAAEEFVVSPERAAQRVATATKRRLQEVPQLVIPLRRLGYPNFPYWKVSLDGSAAVQTRLGRTTRQESALYFGRWPAAKANTVSVPATDQPGELLIPYLLNVKIGARKAPRTYGQIRAQRRTDMALILEPATAILEPATVPLAR